MLNGGAIRLRSKNIRLDSKFVIGKDIAPGDYVMIAVQDEGSGMDEATLSHVFEPFFTTKEVGKGSGLGLSQVYGFLRSAGGHVAVDSIPGHGTTVKLFFPKIDRCGIRGAPIVIEQRSSALGDQR